MGHPEVLERVISTLHEAGWQQAFAQNTCFDLFGKGTAGSLIVKTHGNIDSTAKEDADEMRQAAQFLGAAPLIVGERKSRGELDRQVIYERYGVPAIKPETLEAYLRLRHPTSMVNTRGGTYVRIDETKFERQRQEHGYSLNGLAKEIGVSATTIRKYRSDGMARPDKADRLEQAIGDVTKDIDLFEQHRPVEQARHNPIAALLERLGFEAAGFTRAPFDAAARDETDRYVATEQHRSLDDHLLGFLRDVQGLSDSRSVVITEERISVDGLATITHKKLRRATSKDDFKDEMTA